LHSLYHGEASRFRRNVKRATKKPPRLTMNAAIDTKRLRRDVSRV
jgi:hypothetical protein